MDRDVGRRQRERCELVTYALQVFELFGGVRTLLRGLLLRWLHVARIIAYRVPRPDPLLVLLIHLVVDVDEAERTHKPFRRRVVVVHPPAVVLCAGGHMPVAGCFPGPNGIGAWLLNIAPAGTWLIPRISLASSSGLAHL